MSKPARASFLFGLYIMCAGLLLTTAPNVFLTLLRLDRTTDPWIRVLGVVAVALGAYYVVAGRQENTAFFRMTVWGRAIVLVGFVTLAALGQIPPIVILFGVGDAAGAVWTWTALRSSERAVRVLASAPPP